ncbi:MAG: DUF202 domain-containing protein [Mycobacteriales bacterium]
MDHADPTGPEDLDVDARFLLANERTFLAWVRTALALLAFGAAAEQFGHPVGTRRLVAGLLLTAGMLVAGVGLHRYRSADAALRAGRLPAMGRMPGVLTAVVVVAGVVLLVTSLA